MEIKFIESKHLTRGPLPVRIVKVTSPTLFWVHILHGEEEFQELQENLNRRMNRKAQFLHIYPDQFKLHQLCVIKQGGR